MNLHLINLTLQTKIKALNTKLLFKIEYQKFLTSKLKCPKGVRFNSAVF